MDSGVIPTEDKVLLRPLLRSFRRQLSHRKARQYLINQAIAHFPLPPKPVVAVYAALPNEARVDAMVHRIMRAGQLPLYPLVEHDRLVFIPCTPAELAPGYRGILEPPSSGQRIPLEKLHAVLMPGLGFTCGGTRLGYGGGFYDRTLEQLPTTYPYIHRVGISFQIQVHPSLPVAPHDVTITTLITEWGSRPCPSEH
ncbi:MAG: 5-formyltetrahydrofolate cyclo-ligase [Myxococcales bacterium]|nr:5-formyltetrahydrofolate cyclo-ligase [Myxococcales bacterium]